MWYNTPAIEQRFEINHAKGVIVTDRSIRKKYCFDDTEFFEDELVSRAHAYDACSEEKCVQCGFPIVRGESALEIISNGDILHRQCLEEYIEENLSEFARDFEL